MLSFEEVLFPPMKVQEQKISLNLKQFTPAVPKPIVIPPKPIITPATIETIPVQKPLPKPKVEEAEKSQPIKKKLLDEKKRLVVKKKSSKENNASKVEAKSKQKTVQKKVEKKAKKPTKKKKTKKRQDSKDPLAQMLMDASTSMRPTTSSASSIKMIRQFYGKEFNSFTPKQKKFITKNLGVIHRITQATLLQNGYPSVAVYTRQEGTAIVSFYLHPNGNISELRLKKRIGYEALDNNTLSVIRIAYKDYPRPKSKTKIIFHVQYSFN